MAIGAQQVADRLTKTLERDPVMVSELTQARIDFLKSGTPAASADAGEAAPGKPGQDATEQQPGSAKAAGRERER